MGLYVMGRDRFLSVWGASDYRKIWIDLARLYSDSIAEGTVRLVKALCEAR